MKKTIVAALSLLASSIALALPAPSDIEAAVNAGHLSQAESMVREVTREKPDSAKAHYELGQILAREGRNAEARAQLLEAQRLDPALKFVSDPQHFRDLLRRIPAETTMPARRTGVGERQVAGASAPGTASFPLLYIVIGGGILLVVWLMTRRRTVVQAPPIGATSPAGVPSGYSPPAGPVQGSGSGVGGALLGGAAGLAAGYGLAKLLEEREGAAPVAARRPETLDLVDSGQSVPDYGAFDPGTGDSWDGGGSSGGDDSW